MLLQAESHVRVITSISNRTRLGRVVRLPLRGLIGLVEEAGPKRDSPVKIGRALHEL